MPAKKKTAAKKSAAKKSAAKKATKQVVKKASAKKAPAKKATVKKAPAKKAATKKTAARKAAAKKTATKKASRPAGAKKAAKAPATAAPPEAGDDKPKASELLKRTKHHTPAIFKVSSRKSAPIVFTLENVREILKRKAKEEPKATDKPAVKVKKPVPRPADATPAAPAPAPAGKHGAASLADILGFGGGGSGPTSQRTVPKKWKRFHDLLIELRDHVKQSLGMHAEDTLKRSQKEDTGDLSTSADAGTDSFDRDFALSVVSSEQEALKEIEAAIERIYRGTYGVCEITGDKISDERLEAVPFTRYSLEGQRQHEQTARRRISRAGSFLSEGAEAVSFGDDDNDN